MRRDDPGPYSLETLAGLAVPPLFETDASVLKAKYVGWFEAETGRTLYPMQVEMLLIETLAYVVSLVGAEAQATAEQHLVVRASGAHQDALGPNRSTERLPAAKATTTLRFTVDISPSANLAIDAGTLVSADGGIAFTTNALAIIRPGSLHADVAATAVDAGEAANGFAPGQISAMDEPIDGLTVSNLTVSAGGADAESDALYQLRLANAFDRISSGGGYGWYRETAMGVTSALIDCGVVRPQPCYIELYPLTATGPASLEVRSAILAAFETTRALENRFGDDLAVLPPVAVSVNPVLTVRARAVGAGIADDARAAALAKLGEWGQRLGALVAPHDVEAAVRKLAGIVDVEIAGLAFEQLGEDEFLAVGSLTVNVEWVS